MQISVIIPTYNRARILLPRAIQSVLNQTLEDFELIVVDDSSVDETESVVKSFNDPRITYFRRNQNGGIGAARNDGIRLSSAPYVTFLDSDDEYLPGYLSHAVACISQSDNTVGICWGSYNIRDDKTGIETTVLWNPKKPYGYTDFLKSIKIGTSAGVTIKRDCFKTVMFDESLRVAEDTDFFLRLVQNYTFTTFEGSFLIFHHHEQARLRDNVAEHAEAYGIILKKNEQAILSSPELIEKWVYKVMWLNYHAGKIEEGNAYFKTLLQNRVAGAKSWVVLVLFNTLPQSWARKMHRSINRQLN